MMTSFYKRCLNISALLLALVAFTACGGGGETDTENSMENTEDTQSSMQSEMDSTTAPTAKLNINTASEEDFRTIPNVGDKMVHEFEEYRPYVSIQQFRKEIGKYVNEDHVAAYEKYIFVPIHRNDSDAATVMQIPGLNESNTEELLAGRPFDSNQAFMDALGSYLDEQQMQTAESYMKSE